MPGTLEQLGQLHVHAGQGDRDAAALQLAHQRLERLDRRGVGVDVRLAVEQHRRGPRAPAPPDRRRRPPGRGCGSPRRWRRTGASRSGTPSGPRPRSAVGYSPMSCMPGQARDLARGRRRAAGRPGPSTTTTESRIANPTPTSRSRVSTATNAAIPSQNSLRRKFHSQRNSPNSTILNAANTTRPPSAAIGKLGQDRSGEEQHADHGMRGDQPVGRGPGHRHRGQGSARAAAGDREAGGQAGARGWPSRAPAARRPASISSP